MFKSSNRAFLVKSKNINVDRLDFEWNRPEYQEIESQLLSLGAKKLSEIIRIKKNSSLKLSMKDLEVEYIELSDISHQYSEIINSTKKFVYDLPSRAKYDLKTGDIITAIAGNSIGSRKHVSAFVTKEYNETICSNGFRVMEIKNNMISPFYLLFFFKSEYFLKQVYRYRTGAAIPTLSDNDLLNILMPIPNKNEQLKISKTIENAFIDRQKFRDTIEKF